MITANAASSRIITTQNTLTKNHRHRLFNANHHANMNGAMHNASGWKLIHEIHWIGAYIRYATANNNPMLGRPNRCLAMR